MATEIIELSRQNKSIPWGFSIQGGKEFGCPLSVLKVTNGSIADKFGISVHDFIEKINEESTCNMTHQQAILCIQNLNVKLEIRKHSGSFEDNINCSIRNSDLPLPPPSENMDKRISTNVSELPPPPPDFMYDNISEIESLAIPAPPCAPPAVPCPPPNNNIKNNSIKNNNIQTNNNIKKNNIQITTISNNTKSQSNLKPFQYNQGNVPDKNIQVYSDNSKFSSPSLDPEKVELFKRKVSAGNAKVPSSSIGLGKFLQEQSEKMNVRPPTARETLNQLGADTKDNRELFKQSGGNTNDNREMLKQSGDNAKDSREFLKQYVKGDKDAVCFVCKDHIRGAYIEANNRTYCKDHFTCVYCQKPIQSSQFIETKEGKLYCIEDFTNYIAPKCCGCKKVVIQHQVTALNKVWHPECFVCDYCRQPIPHGSFHTREDGDDLKIYCEQDYQTYFQIKCYACKYLIEGDDKYVKVAGNNYHMECYKR